MKSAHAGVTRVRMGSACSILLVLGGAPAATAWGPLGHTLVTRAALTATDGLPAWFRDAGDALASLSQSPDRWRELEEAVPALAARRPDHFFDLDAWGAEPLPADRWAYVERAARRRLRAATIGFLPFAIDEEYGVLLSAFRDARAGRRGAREAAIAAAGILAHLAGDAAVPLHATRHHHGWVGPNPRGFTRRGEVHRWFESDLVARIEPASVKPGQEAGQALRDVPEAVQAVLADSLAAVPRLYAAEQVSTRRGGDGDALALVQERLAAATTFLARLWCTAWVRSGR